MGNKKGKGKANHSKHTLKEILEITSLILGIAVAIKELIS